MTTARGRFTVTLAVCMGTLAWSVAAALATEGESGPIQLFPVEYVVAPVKRTVSMEQSTLIRKTSTVQGAKQALPPTDRVMKTVSLRDIGVLQLSIHDIFKVNRVSGANTEDGLLNLSALLDNGLDRIAEGGDRRNMGNVIVFSVAKHFGKMYLDLIAAGVPPDKARTRVTKRYLAEVKQAYEHTFDEPFPVPGRVQGDLTGDLALRTLHDLIPGWVRIGGALSPVADLALVAAGKTLTEDELMQRSLPLDARYYQAFRHFTVFDGSINNFVMIDLLERDTSFAQQFNTAFPYSHFLNEVRDGRYDHNEDVLSTIRGVYANAQVAP